ncbi:MAG: EthD family reductase [Streptosporangiales bacterium]|nr:EthD family reductase [Streptosporangiales bacterium]
MATFVALWNQPDDTAGFEKGYERHLELAAKMPGLRRMQAARPLDGAFYRIALLEFDSAAAMEDAFASPAGEKVLEDSASLQERYNTSVERLIVDRMEEVKPSV